MKVKTRHSWEEGHHLPTHMGLYFLVMCFHTRLLENCMCFLCLLSSLSLYSFQKFFWAYGKVQALHRYWGFTPVRPIWHLPFYPLSTLRNPMTLEVSCQWQLLALGEERGSFNCDAASQPLFSLKLLSSHFSSVKISLAFLVESTIVKWPSINFFFGHWNCFMSTMNLNVNNVS